MRYASKKYAWQLFVICLIALIGLYCSYHYLLIESKYYKNAFDPILSFSGVVVPVILGIYFLRKEWEESLDRKLIVHFTQKSIDLCQKEYMFSCYNVNLLPNADMRALGQQIGGQMGQNFGLKFNPSIKPIANGTLETLMIDGKTEWVNYFEIEFLLDRNQVSNTKYLVWNLFEEEKLSASFDTRPAVAFHKLYDTAISLAQLLSSDDASKIDFEKIKIDKPEAPKLYIMNSSIVTNFGLFQYKKIDVEDAKSLIKSYINIESAIGYESTALVISQLLDTTIAQNRIEVKMNPNDQAIVFKPKNRLEEGKVLTKKEFEDLEYELGLLTCVG